MCSGDAVVDPLAGTCSLRSSAPLLSRSAVALKGHSEVAESPMSDDNDVEFFPETETDQDLAVARL
jgi:hypothetical protein